MPGARVSAVNPSRPAAAPARDAVFVSYSHDDQEWRRRFTQMLVPLVRNRRITEAEITETYEVAHSTARRTPAVLRDEGLICTVPQRGSYFR